MGLGPNLLSVSIALAPNQTNQPQVFGETGTKSVSLGTGTGNNQVTLAMHRASVRIQNSGAAAGSSAQVAVWGMSESLQNQLSTLGMVIKLIPRNTISIAAGTDPNGMAVRFVGTILQAYPDLSNPPDVPFRFECLAGAAEQVIPIPASSYPGAASVATIMSQIAATMGWGFENNGVTGTLSNPYLRGSGVEQVRAVAEHAKVNAALVPTGAGASVPTGAGLTLAIWPQFGARRGGVPLIAPPPKGGLIGYPSYTQQGIKLSTIFDPRISFGGAVQVESSLQAATGTWNVYQLNEMLDSLLPKGKWQSDLWCYNPNFPAPIPGQ